jgi:hypothetical protein
MWNRLFGKFGKGNFSLHHVCYSMAGVFKFPPVNAGNQGVVYYHCSKQLQELANKGRDRRKWSLCRIRAFITVLKHLYTRCPR